MTIMKKHILLCALALLLGTIGMVSCSDDESASYLQLEQCIREAEELIAITQEGIEEGNIAPGAKKALQVRIEWAYYILNNSGQDLAYDNAVETLKNEMEEYKSNVVSSGYPQFGYGSKMNLGKASSWEMEEGFTVECNLYYTEFAAGDQNVVSCEGNGQGWMLRSSNDKVQFYIRDGRWTGVATKSLELNKWYHVAATYSKNKEIALYLDGEKVGSTSCKEIEISSVVDLQVGTAPSYDSRYMRGFIQDFSIWSVVRTTEEVANDVKCGFSGTEQGLKAYWPLNMNVGTDILDMTGNYTAYTSGVVWLKEVS